MRFHDSTRHPKRKEVALDTTEYAVAYQRAEEKYERYRRGEYDPWHHRDRDLTLQEFIETYEEERKGVVTEHTIATSISPVRLLQEELGEEASIRSVTPRDIQQIVYQDDLSQGAKLSYYRKLHAVFNWAHDLRYVLSNPVKKVDRPKEPKTLPKYFTEAQVDKLLEAVETVYETNQKYIHEDYVHPLWPQDVYELAAFTGLRRAELHRLNWGDIQWPRRTDAGDLLEPGGILVRSAKGQETKNHAERIVTMVPRAEERLRYLDEHWRQTDDRDEPVLKNCTGRERASTKYASRKFTEYCEEAGLPNITFHGLRHTFAAICRMRGMQLHTLQEEMGHSSIEQTQQYGQIGRRHRAEITYRHFAE